MIDRVFKLWVSDVFDVCFFSSRRRHTRFDCDWSSDVCSSDLPITGELGMSATPQSSSFSASWYSPVSMAASPAYRYHCTRKGCAWTAEPDRALDRKSVV